MEDPRRRLRLRHLRRAKEREGGGGGADAKADQEEQKGTGRPGVKQQLHKQDLGKPTMTTTKTKRQI